MSRIVHAVYFSPTHSSKRMALLLAQGLARKLQAGVLPHDWTLPAGRQEPVSLGAGDVLVFGFPVYGGREPEFFA